MSVKEFSVLLSFAMISSVFSSPATANLRQAPDAEEIKLVHKIARAGLLEVRLGHIALKNAGNATVKAFARQMIAEHSHCNQNLKTAALMANIELPKQLSRDQQKTEAELASLTGAAFDQKYMAEAFAGHRKAIESIKKASKIGTGELKIWAEKTLPLVQHHLNEVKLIKAHLPGPRSIASSEDNQYY